MELKKRMIFILAIFSVSLLFSFSSIGINEMRGALEDGQPVTPAPHPKKCRKCNVRHNCEYRIEPVTEPKPAVVTVVKKAS